jgi:hypothetical protein
MNRGTEGVWVTRTLATRALAARCYRRICIIAAAVVYFRRAHLVGLYSGGRRQRLASLPSTFPPNGCLLVLVPTVHALCVSTLVGRRKAADWAWHQHLRSSSAAAAQRSQSWLSPQFGR